jgi:hypothetical protein
MRAISVEPATGHRNSRSEQRADSAWRATLEAAARVARYHATNLDRRSAAQANERPLRGPQHVQSST